MIIGISGKKGHGKDTVAKIIQGFDIWKKNLALQTEYPLSNVFVRDYVLNRVSIYVSSWQVKKFASTLKEIVSILTGFKVEDLEKEEIKNTNLFLSYKLLNKKANTFEMFASMEDLVERLNHLRTVYLDVYSAEEVNDLFVQETISVTPRLLLQTIGTDIVRAIHPDIWINSLFADYQPLSDIITSNNNFDNRLNHGYNKTKIWRTYYNIKQRCNNPKHPRYNDYGGRGIKMCKEWEDDIMNFINWAKENNYNDSLTIDRINVNQDYSPSNCRCVSYSIQSINTTTRIDNTSGYRGVSRDKHNWRAQIQIKGKSKFLGYFDTPEEASEAYENAFMEREDLYLKEEPNNLIYPSWCITDMRFLNEMEVVKKRGGITIRVNRPCEICGGSGYHKMSCPVSKSGEHLSETSLDKAEFDYVIENSGSLKDLEEKVLEILRKEKLL